MYTYIYMYIYMWSIWHFNQWIMMEYMEYPHLYFRSMGHKPFAIPGMQLGIVPDRWCGDGSKIRVWHQPWLFRLKTEHQVQDDWVMNVATDPHEGKWRVVHLLEAEHSGGGTFILSKHSGRNQFWEVARCTTFFADTVISVHKHNFLLLNWSTTISVNFKNITCVGEFHIAFRMFRWTTMCWWN